MPNKKSVHKLGLPSEIKNEADSEVDHITAYTGKSVDLSDYGVEHPVVYNTAGISFKNSIPYLSNHWRPIGHVTNIKLENSTLTGEGHYSYPGETSKEVKEAIRNGFPMQSSMGLDINEDDVTFVAEGVVQVNNQTFTAPIYVVNKARLVEQSAVMFGRDEETTITKLSKETLMRIKNGKTVPNSSTPPTPPVVENSETTPPTPAPPAPPVEPVHESPSSLISNSALFRLVTLAKDDEKAQEIVTNGLDQGWDENRIRDAVKLHQLEQDYPRQPSPGKTTGDNKAITDQFLIRMGLSLNVSDEYLSKKFDEKTYDNAFRKGPMTLKEMITTVANSNGGNFTGHSDIEDACKYIKRLNNNQQYSTIVFPNLLERVTQFRLEEHWGIGEPWAPSHLLAQSQSSFKPTGRIRPSGGTMWDELDKDGRIQHGSFGEEKTYLTKLRTIAQMLAFKRQDIINDDLGVIEEMMSMMIEGATMAPDFMFVNKLYDGMGTFFQTAKNNAGFGAGAKLDATTLASAYNKVRAQTIKKGDKSVKSVFNTRWTLVVPLGLEQTAWEIIKQSRLVANTNLGDVQGDQNYWFNRVDISTFVNLDNESYHPDADGDTWGLIPNNKMLAPYSISYLNNQRKPTTEIVDLDADMLGFGIRGYWDLEINEREEEAVYFAFPGTVDPNQ